MFPDIYKAASSEEFKRLLKRWYYLGYATSKLDPIKHVARPLNVIGMVYYIGKIHGLIMDIRRLNSILQAAKRKASGYKFKHFKTIAFLVTGKLNLTE